MAAGREKNVVVELISSADVISSVIYICHDYQPPHTRTQLQD